MSNIDRSVQVLKELAHRGVAEIVLCAGARNAAFVEVLSKSKGFQVYSFFEERSAGFFALGRMQKTGRPVAVFTTSGTAVAELLPSVIECDYSGQPLLVVSADRPINYRGTGAPQTIVQPGIFSHYVEKSWDLGEFSPLDMSEWSGRRPAHVNICFDEPLIDFPVSSFTFSIAEFRPSLRELDNDSAVLTWKNFSQDIQKPVLVLGGMTPQQAEVVLPWLRRQQLPIYSEANSLLRGHPDLCEYEIVSGEEILRELRYDSVIRIGSVCTLRAWRDLEKSKVPVLHFSDLPFAGLTRGSVLPLSALSCATFPEGQLQWEHSEWKANDSTLAGELLVKLQLFNRSEPAMVHTLSQIIPEDSVVFLGNSLPIREWDLAAIRQKRFRIHANRGVNGIDGLLSTFIGLADPGLENWAIVGDLSALYDLAGLWAARVRQVSKLNVVILNNGGGKIFSRMFSNSLFENSHDLEFSGLAKLWGWEYQRLESLDDLVPANSGVTARILELVPDAQQTEEFWQ